ncbi:MAG: hypothetical protein GY771_14815 [bacterium]|nr:hypothetical protein [bacterium]
MGKYFAIISVLFLLLASLGCDYFPPRNVEDGKSRLSKLVDEYIAECGNITPFGTEKYEDTEGNLKLAKINEKYIAEARDLLKVIEDISPGEEEGDALKVLRTNADLFVNVLELREDAFSMVNENISDLEMGLYSARFAVLIKVANDEMGQLQEYLN